MYVQSDTLLLAVVFANFINICLKIYEIDPAKSPSALGWSWQLKKSKVKTKKSLLKMTKVKLNICTDSDML